ncbi:MAG TPA: ATP-dependent 6-phosphofructokinase, partial [Sedimentisphaerales bacterium]|nr:ATP-dependent 6-phosphofructokinase [Sedimentisphaerales bacterium]
IKSIAVMTGGGDCPGLNDVIRAVVKTAINQYGLDVWGVQDGYLGLIENRIDRLSYNDVSNILTLGGTILGTSNIANPFRYAVKTGRKLQYKDVSDDCIRVLRERAIDALICIGGDGTMASAAQFARKGLTVMGVPKTIDNDLFGTDVTFGFDTAVTNATEAIDKIHTTASSHHRVMIVEVMGRYAGWIALHAGVAGGADVILIPEIPYDLSKICEYVVGRSSRGKRFSIVVVAEGAKAKDGAMVISHRVKGSPDPIRLGGIANKLASDIASKTALDCRAVVLGHIQRGGTPTPNDRVLATNFGYTAMELLMKGVKNHLVVLKDGRLSSLSLDQVAGKIKTVPGNCPLVRAALSVGTCFGK